MKKLYKLVYPLFVILILSLLVSCEEEDPTDSSCNFQSELAVYQSKLDIYSSNPNTSNCIGLRSSALTLINAMRSCSEYAYYKEALEAWRDLDCDHGDGGGGNNNGGGNGGGGNGGGNTGNGRVTFWTQSDLGCGSISVYIAGYSGTITGYYSSGAPSCGASHTATFSLPAGNYSFSANCQNKTWNGNVTVSSGGCYTMRLY